MRPLALLALALVLAGCAQPSPAPAPDDGPIDLAGRDGLMLVDTETRVVVLLSTTAGPAWVSADGAYLAWAETGYDVVRTPQGERLVTPARIWARIFDDGTGLELAPGEARTRDLRTDNVTRTAPLPPAERGRNAWSAASANLSVLGGEYAGAQPPSACVNALALRTPDVVRFFGCHLEVAADGRAGWTAGRQVQVRHVDGGVENVTASDNATTENPIFIDGGLAYLRVHGEASVEVVLRGANETVVARTSAPHRLALHEATADGRFLLVTSFRR